LKFKRLRIAVVDDEAHVRKALERLMRGAGFDVDLYASGEELLAALADAVPDCVVLDLHMPGINGFELQDTLHERTIHVPLLMMTGYDSSDTRDRAMAAGAFAYFRKPVDGPELIDAITRAVAANTSP
jgi:FixJ family two-component response regulator